MSKWSAFMLVVVVSVFALAMSFAMGANIELSDQGTGAKFSGSLVDNGDLTVQIWDAATGGSLIWSATYIDAINNGSWNLMLGQEAGNPLSLEYGQKYWKDYQINSNDLDFINNSGSIVERLEFYSPLGYINDNSLFNFSMISPCSAGYAIRSVNTGGSVVCEKISEGAVASGWNDTGTVVGLITSTDNVNANTLYVDNTNGRVGIGTTTPGAKLEVSGDIIANNYYGDKFFGRGFKSNSVSYFDPGTYYYLFSVNPPLNGQTGSGDFEIYGNGGFQLVKGSVTARNSGGETFVNLHIYSTTSSNYNIVGYKNPDNITVDIYFTPIGTVSHINFYHASNLVGHAFIKDNPPASPASITYSWNSGNVGIGTTAPGAKLDVEGNLILQYGTAVNEFSTDTALSGNSDSAVPTEKAIKAYVDAHAGSGLTGTGSANYITKWTGTTSVGNSVIYESGGNIGIGTTNPASKLHINDGVLVGSSYVIPSGSIFASLDQVQMLLGGPHNAGYNIGTNKTKLLITGHDNDGAIIYPIYVEDENGLVDFWLKNRQGASASPTAYFAGNVGIGTTSPGAKLDVEGNLILQYGTAINEFSTDTALSGNSDLAVPTEKAIKTYVDAQAGSGLTGTGSANYITKWTGTTSVGNSVIYESGGKIGIGTSTPNAPLVVYGGEGTYVAPNFGSANRGAIHIRSLTSGTRNAITFSSAGSDNAQAGIYVHQDNSAGTHMYFATTNSYATGPQARMTILNNGNVGIGTTSPSYKLHVNGTFYADTVNTGQGANELYAMNQNVRTTDAVTFATIDTGSGAKELGDASVADGDTNSIPTNDQVYDFVTGYVGSGGSGDIYVNEAGDNMTGDLDMNSNDIYEVGFVQAQTLAVADTYSNGQSNLPSGNSMYVQDDIKVGGNIQGAAGDVAENVYIKGELEAGDVVVINEDLTVEKSSKPYDTGVAGIISSDPAYVLATERDGLPLALAGIVPVKVTNESGQIKPRDLLTTSSKPGYAMKCDDKQKCQGAILAKAMGTLNGSEGIINALVMLG